MTAIAKLPEDVLYLINLYFERDREFLCTLCRVNRAFLRAARGLVFRHISDRLATIEQYQEKERLLERSFDADPSLRLMVHSAHVDIEDGVITKDGLNKALAFANLRELSIDRQDKPKNLFQAAAKSSGACLRAVGKDFDCGFLDHYLFSRLRTITVSSDFTSTEVLRFMLLPNVGTFKGQHLFLHTEPLLPPQCLSMKSQITSLTLTGGDFWYMTTRTMQAILARGSMLMRLRCQIPMVTRSNGSPYKSRTDQAVSPRELDDAFAPVRDTLKELSLLQMLHDVAYDGSHMNFSSFVKLTALEITSCCLLGTGAPHAGRSILYSLLPPSLRRLKLDLPRQSGIFYHHLEDEPFRLQDIHDIPRDRYSWILELLTHCAISLPDLQSIRMEDPPGNIGYWNWLKSQWTPPHEVADVCKELSMDLNVQISYPNPDSETETYDESRNKPRYGLFPWGNCRGTKAKLVIKHPPVKR